MANRVKTGKTSDGYPYYIAGGASITLYEDYLEWDGGLLHRERANIYYSDIISVTYVNGDFFVNASFQISTAGKNYTIKMTCAYANLEVIANAIERERTKVKNKQSQNTVRSSISVPDEIEKFSKLKDQGILSEAEFELAKKNLLEGKTAPQQEATDKAELWYIGQTPVAEADIKKIKELISSGGKLAAIEHARSLTGISLYEGKDFVDNIHTLNLNSPQTLKTGSTAETTSSGGCYVATAVYGSYDCPQVWTLRRFRDNTLGKTWYGRAFISTYYAISPTLVKWFGSSDCFKKLWKHPLDSMVKRLNADGVENTPYQDKNW